MLRKYFILGCFALLLSACETMTELDRSISKSLKNFTSTQSKSRFSKQVYEAQILLAQKGYSVGTADGVYGKKTAAALTKFQQDNGLPVTSVVDDKTLSVLRAPKEQVIQESTAPKTQEKADPEIGAFDIPPQPQEDPSRSNKNPNAFF